MKRPGETVRTTLDATLQRLAVSALRQQLAALEENSVEDGAIVVLENASGDVMAYVGSNRQASGVPEFDGVIVPREASTMLKPFVYELAMERRALTAAPILDDSPVSVGTSGPSVLPQNHDQHFKGPLTVRTALSSSIDVSAAPAWALVGDEAIYERLHSLAHLCQIPVRVRGFSPLTLRKPAWLLERTSGSEM